MEIYRVIDYKLEKFGLTQVYIKYYFFKVVHGLFFFANDMLWAHFFRQCLLLTATAFDAKLEVFGLFLLLY